MNTVGFFKLSLKTTLRVTDETVPTNVLLGFPVKICQGFIKQLIERETCKRLLVIDGQA